MNRRGFLNTLIGGVAATAAVRTWPFRVYSFPNVIKTYQVSEVVSWEQHVRIFGWQGVVDFEKKEIVLVPGQDWSWSGKRQVTGGT